MDLLDELRRETGMAVMLITHDLGVVAGVADRIAVMYAGRIVEHADVHTLYATPGHPYTKALLQSIPRLDQEGETLVSIKGLPPNLTRIPSGCPFHPRCPRAEAICSVDVPPTVDLGRGHTSACHFAREVRDSGR
jgi:peptide/nickel transport system ATP-binding protein